MKLILLITLLVCGTSVAADEAKALIKRLPDIRSKARVDTAKLSAGSTPEMIEAANVMCDRLLPLVVTLEAALEKSGKEAVKTEIERDLEAISRDAHIRGHASGWAGTAVLVESASAMVSHLEARASWCVWQLMKDEKGFDFESWHTRWEAKS